MKCIYKATLSYCLKFRKNTESKNTKVVKSKNKKKKKPEKKKKKKKTLNGLHIPMAIYKNMTVIIMENRYILFSYYTFL